MCHTIMFFLTPPDMCQVVPVECSHLCAGLHQVLGEVCGNLGDSL